MISMRLTRRGLAGILGLSLLSAGPVWAEEQLYPPPRLEGKVAIGSVSKVDFRAAVRAVVLADTGLAIPSAGATGLSGQAAAASPATAAAHTAASRNKSPDWSTVPPNAPRTTHNQKLAAFTVLGILTVAAVVLTVREIRRDDPVLTPGTPTRIP
jgi:hypothetical protein